MEELKKRFKIKLLKSLLIIIIYQNIKKDSFYK